MGKGGVSKIFLAHAFSHHVPLFLSLRSCNVISGRLYGMANFNPFIPIVSKSTDLKYFPNEKMSWKKLKKRTQSESNQRLFLNYFVHLMLNFLFLSVSIIAPEGICQVNLYAHIG